jgi:hypothetical protein
MGLDFDLSSKLVLTASFLHLVFEDDFESYNVFASLLAGQVNVAELAFAQRFADFKVVQAPLFTVFVLEKKKYFYFKMNL